MRESELVPLSEAEARALLVRARAAQRVIRGDPGLSRDERLDLLAAVVWGPLSAHERQSVRHPQAAA